MKNSIVFAAILFLFFFANAQSETNLKPADTVSLTPETQLRVLSNAELTEAVFRIDNDIRKAGTLIVAGSLTSLCGTGLTLIGSMVSRNNYTGRLSGLSTATTIIGAFAGVGGIILTIIGADKLRNVRLMANGVSIKL